VRSWRGEVGCGRGGRGGEGCRKGGRERGWCGQGVGCRRGRFVELIDGLRVWVVGKEGAKEKGKVEAFIGEELLYNRRKRGERVISRSADVREKGVATRGQEGKKMQDVPFSTGLERPRVILGRRSGRRRVRRPDGETSWRTSRSAPWPIRRDLPIKADTPSAFGSLLDG
jgi:hypothetical protein